MKKLKSVTIERAAGPHVLCVTKTFPNMTEAQAWLTRQAPTFLSDSHDYKLVWEDGYTFEGRFEATPKNHDLAKHIRGIAESTREAYKLFKQAVSQKLLDEMSNAIGEMERLYKNYSLE